MQFSQILMIVLIALAAFAINIPLGRLRSRQPKLSTRWFVYVHLSIPMIFVMRNLAGLGFWAAPIFIAAAVTGQIVGGK